MSYQDTKYLSNLPNDLIIYEQFEKNELDPTFYQEVEKIDDIQETSYYTNQSASSSSYYENKKNSTVLFQNYYVDTNFFNFPIKLDQSYDRYHLLYGKLFDQTTNEKSVIISNMTSKLMFGKENAVGRYLYLYSDSLTEERFKIIGIVSYHLDEYQNFMKNKNDNSFSLPVFIPIKSLKFTNQMSKTTYFHTKETNKITRLAETFKINNIIITNNFKSRKIDIDRTNFINQSFILIALSIIMAANINGVFKTMLYSRRKEIGIKRSLGASKFAIFLQFSIESFVILLLNMIISLLLSLLILCIYVQFKKADVPDLTIYIQSYTFIMFLGMTFCQCFSLSITTAFTATKLDIIDLLNREE